MNNTYTIIDRTKENTAIYISSYRYLAIHEYLSIILNELNILKKYKLHNIKDLKSKFNNLYIVQEDKSTFDLNKKYPIILARIYLNMNSWKLYYKWKNEEDKGEELDNSNTIDVIELVNQIKKNVIILVGGTGTIKSKSRSRPRHRLKSNLNDTPLIFEQNSYIKSENTDKKLVKIIEDVNDDPAKENSVNTSLADEIAELKEKRKILEDNISNYEATHKKDMDKCSDVYNNLNDKKNLLFKKKEKEKEMARVFESDKVTYIKIKNDFEEGRLKEIPSLFADKYPVFEQMNSENRMYDDDSYEYYKKLYKSINASMSTNISKPKRPNWRRGGRGCQGRNRTITNNKLFDSPSHSDLKNKYNIMNDENIPQKISDDLPDDDFNILDDNVTDNTNNDNSRDK
uniref:Uncharacterized protein n=1 Tax=Mimivirus LCMiAC02 TaxID=2506609 RepID=A0A481Z168_9VIRU|nr:MAG: hypothetical protein LCMiAC02_02630 [Mimivirus LCMiAC02]